MTCWVSFTKHRNWVGNIPQSALICGSFFALSILFSSGAALAASPIVDSFTADPQAVLPGGTVVLTVEAHDPDCATVCTSGCGQYIREDLTTWTASGGLILAESNGTSASPYTATADWQAPEVEGTYTITVYLGDSGGFMCGGRATVTTTLDVVVSTVTGEPPVIQSVTASPVRVFPEEQALLTCSATDPDGDPVTYSWTTDLGTVMPGAGGTATLSSSDPGVATVTCTASDPSGSSSSDIVLVSVSAAEAEKAIRSAVVAPQRLDVASWGDVYVADRSLGGISVVNLFSGERVYLLPMPDITSVAVDWADNLAVAGADTARVVDRRGNVLLTLDPIEALGRIADVAVDSANRRYGVLYQKTGRVVVFDEVGAVVAAFGATGDGVDQFRGPRGLAATPAGEWLVADNGHGEIKRFDANGVFQASFGGLGDRFGEFVQLEDVDCDDTGVVYATDSYQDWIVAFNPDGTPREAFGTYGNGLGELKTASGIAPVPGFDRFVASSRNGPAVQVFVTTRNPQSVVPAPSTSIAPTDVVFPSQPVGTQSAPQTVTLTNTGDSPLGVRGVTIAQDFSQTNSCASFLDPGESCSFSITLVPTRAGVLYGKMTVDTSATGPPAEVALTGIGAVPPTPVLSPASLVFAGQVVGTTSGPATVTLTNAGTEPMVIGGILVSGDYDQSSTCGGTLAGGASCAIQVVFSPTTVAAHLPGTVSVSSNAAGSPHVVPLDGEGLPPDAVLSISDASVTEGDGSPATAIFTVTMTGYSPDTVSVDYGTVNGTATEVEDYSQSSGTLTFPDGVTSRTISVPITDDDVLEPDEEIFRVDLTNPVNATVDIGSGTGSIFDDELCPSPNLLINGYAEDPLASGAIPGWTVTTGEWRLGPATPDPFEGSAYFAAGAAAYSELSQTVDVRVFADTIDADSHEFGFEGFVRTAEDDVAGVVVEYLDATGSVLDVFDPGDISSPAAWTRVADTRYAPPLTRTIRVSLIGQRVSGDTAEAFFDSVAVVSLRAPTVWLEHLTVYEGDVGATFDALFTARLACRYFEDVSGRVRTNNGTAVAGEDYLAADEPMVLPAGEVAASVPVTILGDDVDEDHEYFYVDITPDPGAAVAPLSPAFGTIFNDDFCPQDAAYWRANPDLWPVDSLVIGATEYDKDTLLSLLGYSGSDVSHELAREQVATKLNLQVGSDPKILNVVDEADAFLISYPPGSRPGGQAKQKGIALVSHLVDYNTTPCP